MSRRVLITGSSGLIGSSMVLFFDELGWETVGIDNNMRGEFFGADGDTGMTLQYLEASARSFRHVPADIRDRMLMDAVVANVKPSLIIHAAAQPSHDLAKQMPFADFDINAVGTLNLLEAARRHCPAAPFVFLSTNKVYGDAPNRLALKEFPMRYDYAEEGRHGIDESCSIDNVHHTLMGASKLAADIMVQEYGRNFGMPTVCFRCGCLTGGAQAGAEQHGFLAYMSRAVSERRTYRIFGYGGKQVRDNLHARDVCSAAYAFFCNPKIAAVYNLGGGRENSVSVLEALERFALLFGSEPKTELLEQNRQGDHLCYISDTRRFRADYPDWEPKHNLDAIFDELLAKRSADAKISA